MGMNVCIPSPQYQSSANNPQDIPHPWGFVPFPLEMHSHLGNPSEPQHRRSFFDHASLILPGLRNTIHGPLHPRLPLVEHHSQSLLHPLFNLHPLLDAESVCAHKRKRKGMEAWSRVFGGQRGNWAARHVDI